jgi:hypothetical protein
MKRNFHPDSADIKDERTAFDRERVVRVLTWFGFLALGVALLYFGKVLVQHYLK